jgi:O-antigen ligase
MNLSKTISDPETVSSVPTARPSATPVSLLSKLSRWTGHAIFLLLIFFTIALPHSIKGAQHAWRVAFVLWLFQLLVDRRRPLYQVLSAPLLAYVTLSGISTALSFDPILSWDRMKIVCLLLVGILFAQNLKRLTQVRVLLGFLLFSAMGAAAFTGWQYTYGIGVQIRQLPSGSPLAVAGIRPNDIITSLNRHSVHTPEQLTELIRKNASWTPLDVRLVRGFPFEKLGITLSRDAFERSGLGTERVVLARGKPKRAQGQLGHYVVFAEMLMQLGCLAWALLLSTRREQHVWQAATALTFASVTAALLLTETRAAMAGLAIGCFVAVVLLTGRRSRKWAISTVLLLILMAAFWTRYIRHVKWIDPNDTGTHFRVLMWQDGLRLIGQHPWFGIGMESVRTYWRQWNIRGFAQYQVVSHFHCTFLQIAVDRGLPTLIAWLWFVVAYIIFLIRVIRKAQARSEFAAGVLAGILAGFVAFQVTSLVHYNLGEEPLVTILFFYFGLAIGIDRMLNHPAALDAP